MKVQLKSGVWYYDEQIDLTFPDSWDVAVHRPDIPPPLTENEIRASLSAPVNQPPLNELASGKNNPVIIIDDLTRPTPTFKIMPYILELFKLGGIDPKKIRIVVASGTHGLQNSDALREKIGKTAYDACRVIVHDCRKKGRYLGKTTFGTPVVVNREVFDSDLIVGIGGAYPHTIAGFGGGAKLALGVLGLKSIAKIHYSRKGRGPSQSIDNDFRNDLVEAARMIKLDTMFTLHIDENKEIVNLLCGDHFSYFPDAAAFTAKRYLTPDPSDADVVIVNAYPFDLSFCSMRKAYEPLLKAPRSSTRIIVATNPEGLGQYILFPFLNTRLNRYREICRKLFVLDKKIIFENLTTRLTNKKNHPHQKVTAKTKRRIDRNRFWVYRPFVSEKFLPDMDGIIVSQDWKEVIDKIKRDHPDKNNIRVRIYPCGGLHYLRHMQS